MYLHLWNTWINNVSSQTEEADFGSNDICIFFPFSLFVSVYVYASVCDFVCIALLLPFLLGFCLSVFVFLFLGVFIVWFLALVIIGGFVFCFAGSLFLSSFSITLKKFLIIIFYFNDFNFILFYLFCFFFFLPFILSCVDDRLLVLQPGVRAVPLKWESQVQDTGPQETSQLHVISNGENLPEISISTPRPSSTQRPASYSAGHPMPNN